jgi:hypothetical protein
MSWLDEAEQHDQAYAKAYDNSKQCICRDENGRCTGTAFAPEFLCDYCIQDRCRTE